ncbi:MAG: Transposase [Candidatus Giovannonibacteria bacterium GW2011_GWA2_44_13b]|uniref:Transposase n=1 Tax=Candidatus Giovannonibacteria bacterium GW2011_GWA2_44_13b TaxID=1618647 RepID=A0A0G1JW87_9BACT|nr:MAG: Transposase [Candidatus Giovannonibacteria bacterium GW2011_GWA2_44_13b]
MVCSMRKVKFTDGEFYHIYNRGTDKRKIFVDENDLERFLQSLREFNNQKPIGSLFENSFRDKTKLGNPVTKLVDIVCYCLNPNHFHLILKQRIDGGLSEFMHRLGSGYTRFFNIKYKRSGVLFQGKFKAKHINSNNYLLRVGTYVNQNNLVHKIRGNFYRSSWLEYANKEENLCAKSIILDQFKNIIEFKEFSAVALKSILENKKPDKELEAILLEN